MLPVQTAGMLRASIITSRDVMTGALRDAAGHSWAGRRVAVVGLGASGRSAAQLLIRAGCLVDVTDSRRTLELEEAAARLSGLGAESIELGGHAAELIGRSELVVVSPGINEAASPLQWASAAGIPVISEIELAFRFCRAPVVAVTGTNGKSSVTTLIQRVAELGGRHAVACGNLGLPFASVIDRLTPQSIAVVEISSFQLVHCQAFRPRIAVLLNIGTNHLDRHRNRQAYATAKARLFQSQTAEDWAVLNGGDPAVTAVAHTLRARRVWFGDARANREPFVLHPATQAALNANAQAALQVGRILGLADPVIWQAIRAFRGLEHRLEYVASCRGVAFINDSKSTTPESLLHAVEQCRGSLVLIVGGRDKALDLQQLAGLGTSKRIRAIILVGETREKLRALFQQASHVQEAPTLEAAVRQAYQAATPGETVLFSPACASFDMFRNFEERGRVFKALVHRVAADPPSRESTA